MQDSYRFIQFWLIVGIILAPSEVRSSCSVHGDGDSSWSRRRLAGRFIRTHRPQMEGVARVIIGRPFSESVAIVQTEGG